MIKDTGDICMRVRDIKKATAVDAVQDVGERRGLSMNDLKRSRTKRVYNR